MVASANGSMERGQPYALPPSTSAGSQSSLCPMTCRSVLNGVQNAQVKELCVTWFLQRSQFNNCFMESAFRQVLHMSGNPLVLLPKLAFRMTGLINLQKLYLSNCSLERVDATAFDGLLILIELDLRHNSLREAIKTLLSMLLGNGFSCQNKKIVNFGKMIH